MTLLEAVQLSREIIEEHAAHLDDPPRPATRVEKLARWVVDHFGSDPAMADTLVEIVNETPFSTSQRVYDVGSWLCDRGRVR